MGMKNYVVLLGSTCIMAMVLTTSATKVASKECLDDCKPICMNLDGAVESICNFACSLGCLQLLGKGKFTEHKV